MNWSVQSTYNFGRGKCGTVCMTVKYIYISMEYDRLIQLNYIKEKEKRV